MQVPRRVSAGARTNVPVWPAQPPSFDQNAAARVVIAIEAGVPDGWPDTDVRRLGRWRTSADDEAFRRTAAELAAVYRVGVRVGVVGAGADVLLLRAHLLDAGFVDGELHLHATSTDDIRLRCAHCSLVTRAGVRPGGIGGCPACGYELIVHPHFSPRHAAYLGVRIDAEQPA